MLFNGDHCEQLTPDLVNTASGLHLHQFAWLTDEEIGDLPERWNALAGVQTIGDDARLLHYNLGGPWFDDCRQMEQSQMWQQAHRALNHPSRP